MNTKEVAKTALREGICKRMTIDETIKMCASALAVIVLIIYVMFIRNKNDPLDYAALRVGLIATLIGGFIGAGIYYIGCRDTKETESRASNSS